MGGWVGAAAAALRCCGADGLRHSWLPRRCLLSLLSLLCPAGLVQPLQGLSSKDVKFACKERAALLSLLYRGVELAVARGSCGLGPTLLG